jgi:Radical SAM superfamily
MILNKFGFDWFSYFRCSNADAESFDLLAESGCKGVFLGIESGDDRVLRAMNKAATIDKYAQGIDQLNRRGIITYASFIIGHPGETEDTVKNTFAFINATGPMFYCLESFFYDPKVPIASRASDFGLSGTAYTWKHNTMDWERASELVEEGYRTISNSIILPLYGFDLWSIAYLLGQGMSLDQIRRFLGVASKLLPYLANDERTYALERELIDVFNTANQGLVNY